MANRAGAERVHAINPRKDIAALPKVNSDLVTSLFSCGFHYPITEYVDVMLATVASGGAVVLDVRKRYLLGEDPAFDRPKAASKQTVILNMEKSKRVMFRL